MLFLFLISRFTSLKMFGGGQGVNYDDGGPLRVPELKILLSMHNLSTVGLKANLFGRLRDYMKNRSGKHVKTEPGLLPLPCKDPQITQFYQPNGWAKHFSQGHFSLCFSHFCLDHFPFRQFRDNFF